MEGVVNKHVSTFHLLVPTSKTEKKVSLWSRLSNITGSGCFKTKNKPFKLRKTQFFTVFIAHVPKWRKRIHSQRSLGNNWKVGESSGKGMPGEWEGPDPSRGIIYRVAAGNRAPRLSILLSNPLSAKSKTTQYIQQLLLTLFVYSVP